MNDKKEIPVLTIDYPNRNYTPIGVVYGCNVKAANAIKDVMSNIRNLVGGHMTHYAMLINESVAEAISIMKEEANKLNADAIVGFRIATSDVAAGASEIIVYGTAIKFNK